MSSKKSQRKDSVLWIDTSGMVDHYLFLNVKTGYYLLSPTKFSDLERGWTLEKVKRDALESFVYTKIDWSKYKE